MKPFKIISRETLFDSPFCPIEKQRVELPDGTETDWFVNQGADVVIVVPILADGQVLLQQQYKHGSGVVVTEFCAGMVDPGERPQEAAIRELREETGYESTRWQKIGESLVDPTGSSKRHHFFLARDCVFVGDSNPEPTEQIELLLVKDFKTAEELLFNTDTKTASTMIAALKYVEKAIE